MIEHTNKKRNLLKKKPVAFGSRIVKKSRDALRKLGSNASRIALKAAHRYIKGVGGKQNIRTPRIIPIPKVGGVLPLIPIFARLSVLGSLAGTATGIAKAVQAVKTSGEQFNEALRHNKSMEAIALGKSGEGVFMKPYRKGLYIDSKNN